MYTYMYIYIYICIYTYVLLYIYLYEYICICIHMHINMYFYKYIHTYIHTYIYMYLYVYMYVCIYIYIHIYIYIGAVKTPKNPPPINPSKPSGVLDIHWVHGYTSGSTGGRGGQAVKVSNNLFYNLEGDAIYPAAALGIKLKTAASSSSSSQTYFRGHNDDIVCLTMSPCRRYLATGQSASKESKGMAGVCIWDALGCRELCRMDRCHQRGVVSLCFSPSSNQLLTIGQDDQSTHILWMDLGGSWSSFQQTATQKSDRNSIFFSRWVHPKNNLFDTEYQVVSGGGSINFWRIEGSSLSKK
jgi:hypothetical protein